MINFFKKTGNNEVDIILFVAETNFFRQPVNPVRLSFLLAAHSIASSG